MESVHEKKPFKCSDCDEVFSQKGNLDRHIEPVHERYKPFKFNNCGAAFYLKRKSEWAYRISS